jgi:hypothetical protein
MLDRVQAQALAVPLKDIGEWEARFNDQLRNKNSSYF